MTDKKLAHFRVGDFQSFQEFCVEKLELPAYVPAATQAAMSYLTATCNEYIRRTSNHPTSRCLLQLDKVSEQAPRWIPPKRDTAFRNEVRALMHRSDEDSQCTTRDNVEIRPSSRSTPAGLVAYVLGQLGEGARTSHSVHARRPMKRGQVVLLYRGHVITSSEETVFEESLVPLGETCAYTYNENIPLGRTGKTRVEDGEEKRKVDVLTTELLLSSKPHLEHPRSWGGYLNDGACLQDALGERLAADVGTLASLLADTDGDTADEWFHSCCQGRAANVEMRPCIIFDVRNGEAIDPEFFMAAELLHDVPQGEELLVAYGQDYFASQRGKIADSIRGALKLRSQKQSLSESHFSTTNKLLDMIEQAYPLLANAAGEDLKVKNTQAAIQVLSHIRDPSVKGRARLTVKVLEHTLALLQAIAGTTVEAVQIQHASCSPRPTSGAPVGYSAPDGTPALPAATASGSAATQTATESLGGGDTKRTADTELVQSTPVSLQDYTGAGPLAAPDSECGLHGVTSFEKPPGPGSPADLSSPRRYALDTRERSPQSARPATEVSDAPGASPAHDREPSVGEAGSTGFRGSAETHSNRGAQVHRQLGFGGENSMLMPSLAHHIVESRAASPAGASGEDASPCVFEEEAAATASLTPCDSRAAPTDCDEPGDDAAHPDHAFTCQSSPFRAAAEVGGAHAPMNDHPHATIDRLRREAGIISDDDAGSFEHSLDTPPSRSHRKALSKASSRAAAGSGSPEAAAPGENPVARGNSADFAAAYRPASPVARVGPEQRSTLPVGRKRDREAGAPCEGMCRSRSQSGQSNGEGDVARTAGGAKGALRAACGAGGGGSRAHLSECANHTDPAVPNVSLSCDNRPPVVPLCPIVASVHGDFVAGSTHGHVQGQQQNFQSSAEEEALPAPAPVVDATNDDSDDDLMIVSEEIHVRSRRSDIHFGNVMESRNRKTRCPPPRSRR